jgi:two-component system, sensor histidine kinase
MAEAGKNGHPSVHTAGQPELSKDLLRTLVHDLRNPLAPIRNAAELLRTLCTDSRQLESVALIARQVNHLTRSLDDLSAALDGGRNELLINEQRVELSGIVEPALQAIRPIVDRRRQNLVVSLPSAPVQMDCDPVRLAQVVQLLLGNAAANTPEGGSIALYMAVEDRRLSIEVRDDGAGLTSDNLRAMFNVFAPASPASSAATPSTVNFAIARHVVEMHGGSIEAFSDGVGRGSRFVIRLPLASAGEPKEERRPSVPDESRRVILIDDDEDSVAGLREVLAEAGHSILTANTGEIGIALAERFDPHAVIIDIGLPGMDGFEVGKRLRENPATAHATLIALSGYSLKQFRELSAYSIFRHYLLKPASAETILVILERARRSAGRAPTP